MDPQLIAAFLCLGAATGFAAGLLGIGGGMPLVPFFIMLMKSKGFPAELIVHMAIASSLGTIMFTSLSSMRAHHRAGAVLWPVAGLLAPGILVGSWIGPWIGKQMNSSALSWFFGVFVTLAATQMLIDRKPVAARELPGAPGMLVAGAGIGVLAGLVGAGGGFLSVPFMSWCRVKIHNAVATSAALGFPIAVAGTLSNIYQGWGTPNLPAGALGFVYVPAVLAASLASVITAPFGARTAHKTPVRTLRRVFAGVMYVLAVYMMFRAAR